MDIDKLELDSLTMLVDELKQENEALIAEMKFLRTSRDKWKAMAEFFANRMVKKLGE